FGLTQPFDQSDSVITYSLHRKVYAILSLPSHQAVPVNFRGLETKEIYFGMADELNDPMERFKDLFWLCGRMMLPTGNVMAYQKKPSNLKKCSTLPKRLTPPARGHRLYVLDRQSNQGVVD